MERLVDAPLRESLHIIRRTDALLERLSRFPEAWLSRELSRTDPLVASRSFMWAVMALEATALDTKLRKHPNPESHDLLLRAIRHFARVYSYQTQVKNDSYWLLSSCAAFRALERYSKAYGSSDLEAAVQDAGIGYTTAAADIEKLLTAPRASLDWYTRYWAMEELRHLKGTETTDATLRSAWHDSVASMERQLALRVANAPAASSLELAMAASAAHEGIRRGTVTSAEQAQAEVQAAVRLCCGDAGSDPGRRLVVKTDSDGEIHSLIWEDVFVLTSIDASLFPAQPVRFRDVVRYIEDRVVSTGGVGGVLDESHEHYPEAAPYFTMYSIVLLSRIKCVAKVMLRMRLRNRLREFDPAAIIKRSRLKGFSDPNLADTYEGTYSALARRIPETQMQFQESLPDFNTILLFGPPGTGKSTLIEVLLAELEAKNVFAAPMVAGASREAPGWLGLTLAPSLFLVSDSFSEILANAAEVFEVLLEADNCVLLFDEAEELIRGRVDEEHRFGRMLTSAMLLYLNRLKTGQSIYVFATNFIEKMDEAAIRKGRFAVRKGVGWVRDEHIGRAINRLSATVQGTTRSEIELQLKERPIAEVRDLVKWLNRVADVRPLDVAEVTRLLAREWKRYLSPSSVDDHKLNCVTYDDDVVP